MIFKIPLEASVNGSFNHSLMFLAPFLRQAFHPTLPSQCFWSNLYSQAEFKDTDVY